MKSYIIVDLTQIDKSLISDYGTEMQKTLKEFEGVLLFKGNINALHGDSLFKSKVILEFPDKERALSWYESENYQNIVTLRDKAMDSQFHLID